MEMESLYNQGKSIELFDWPNQSNSIEWLNSIDRINQNSIEFTFFFSIDWIRLDSITLNYSIDSNEFDYYSIGFDYYSIEFDHYSIEFD